MIQLHHHTDIPADAPPQGGFFVSDVKAMLERQPDDPGVEAMTPKEVAWLAVLQTAALLVFLAIIFLVPVFLSKAKAHNAPSGWQYPLSCCSGRDCAEIPASSVKDSPSGYFVTVIPGSHPMWPVSKPQALHVTVPYSKAEASPDGRWHLCINAAGAVLCFYHVPGGM